MSNYKILNDLHIAAMKKASEAYIAKLNDDNTTSKRLYNEAFKFEKEAAYMLIDEDIEPSRSVLFRSAASLAILTNNISEAKKLIFTGLQGNPPSEIREELEILKRNIDEENTINGVTNEQSKLRPIRQLDEVPVQEKVKYCENYVGVA